MSKETITRRREGDKNPNWKGGKISKICIVCGTGFEVAFYRKDKARFCTLPCANIYQAEHPYPSSSKGRKSPRNKPLVEVPCRQCGIVFKLQYCRRNNKFFCCKECQFQWRSERFSGEGNPNWVGGVSRLPYPFDWAQTSKRIRKRDGNVCRNFICTAPASTRISVHHIDYDKQNCNDHNLITLCSVCNSKANFDRDGHRLLYSNFNNARL
mgnify:FL=1